MDRQQLDGGHPEFAQAADRGRRGQPGVGPAHVVRNPRVLSGEALDVGFVDDGLVPRGSRRAVLPPAKSWFDHARQRRKRRAVAFVEARVVARAVRIPVESIVPMQVTADRLGVRIEHDFVCVETVASLGLVRAVNPVAVELPRADVGQVGVPHFVIHLRKRDAL